MATTFEKTWQSDINRAPSDNTTVANLSKSFVWWVKAFLKGQQGGAASGLWSVYYSCDSVTAGTANDGVDRWDTASAFDATKIVRAAAGVAHSWMVLKSPAFSTPAGSMTFYCILDYSGSADNTPLNLVFSKAAPSGGTTTARPTATDEWTHPSNSQLNDNTNSPMKFHGGLATDGNFWLAASKTGSGLPAVGAIFHVLSEARSVDLYPAVTYFSYDASNAGAFTSSNGVADCTDGTKWKMRFFDGSGVTTNTTPLMPVYSTSTHPAGLSWQTAKTDFTDGFLGDFPMYIANNDANKASKRGRLADILYLMGNPTQPSGEPTSGSVTSIQLGNLWFPVGASGAVPVF